MSIWQRLSDATFTGERTWAWRRRMAFAGCGVGLWSYVHAVRFEPDHAWGAIVLTNSIILFAGTLTAYLGIATVDDHNKRETERKAEEGRKP